MDIVRSFGVVAMACCLAGCLTDAGDSATSSVGTGSAEGGQGGTKTLVHCDRPIGSVALVEPEPTAAAAFQSVGLQSPVPMLRIMAAESNCFRVIDRAAARGSAVQYLMTPNILLSNPNAGGFNTAGLVSMVPGAGMLGSAVGDVRVKEAQTALFLSDARSGEQKAAVQGAARATDFSVSFAGFGRGLDGAGGYGTTPEGKVVMAAYLDAFNKLVAQMQAGRGGGSR